MIRLLGLLMLTGCVTTAPPKPRLSIAVTTFVKEDNKDNYNEERYIYTKDNACNNRQECFEQCILSTGFVNPPNVVEIQMLCTIIDPVADIRETIHQICHSFNEWCGYHDFKKEIKK